MCAICVKNSRNALTLFMFDKKKLMMHTISTFFVKVFFNATLTCSALCIVLCFDNHSLITVGFSTVIAEEGKPTKDCPEFTARQVILGHLQQGGTPSPLDRVRAARLAGSCVQFLLYELDRNCVDGTVSCCADESAAVIGIHDCEETVVTMEQLETEVDFKHRCSKYAWWSNVHSLIRILEGSVRPHDMMYTGEAEVVPVGFDEAVCESSMPSLNVSVSFADEDAATSTSTLCFTPTTSTDAGTTPVLKSQESLSTV
eukprot:m.197560 g.197560  ORF g.197560 m.197560 type:complete len:257 (+) comp14911_c0_seq23:2050-2820(+)